MSLISFGGYPVGIDRLMAALLIVRSCCPQCMHILDIRNPPQLSTVSSAGNAPPNLLSLVDRRYHRPRRSTPTRVLRVQDESQYARSLPATAPRECYMAIEKQSKDPAGDTSRCASLVCASDTTHAQSHHSRTVKRRLHLRYTTDRHTTRPPPSSITRPRRSRAEFRQNRRETDATKLQKMLSDASTGLQTMHTQIGWKNSPEIGNTSGVLSGIKPAAGD